MGIVSFDEKLFTCSLTFGPIAQIGFYYGIPDSRIRIRQYSPKYAAKFRSVVWAILPKGRNHSLSGDLTDGYMLTIPWVVLFKLVFLF